MITRDDIFKNLTGLAGQIYIADHFAKYTNSENLSRFLCRYELYKLAQGVRGSVCECGLQSGAGLLQWWHISKLLSPHDIRQLIFGFDTFEGFPTPSAKDGPAPKAGMLKDHQEIWKELDLCIQAQENLEFTVIAESPNKTGDAKYARKSTSRLLPIKGDFMKTGPEFVAEYQHLVLALLFLDFDLYEPTKLALELFLPRMPKGAVLAFDELNNSEFPGETLAAMETIGVRNMQLNKFSFNKDISYAIL